MSKRIQLGLLVLVCVAFGWIAGQFTDDQGFGGSRWKSFVSN